MQHSRKVSVGDHYRLKTIILGQYLPFTENKAEALAIGSQWPDACYFPISHGFLNGTLTSFLIGQWSTH
jgi:hypothetical protein